MGVGIHLYSSEVSKRDWLREWGKKGVDPWDESAS